MENSHEEQEQEQEQEQVVQIEQNKCAECHEVEITIENTNTVGSVSETLEAQTGIFINAEAGVTDTDISVSASLAEGDKASVTVNIEVSDQATGCAVNAAVTVQSGVFVDASVQAGAHGIAADANASIGSSVSVDGSVTESNEYSSTTLESGISIGEQLSIGGGGETTYSKGVVSGDVAAIVGVDVDVSTSVNIRNIASDVVADSAKITHLVAGAKNTIKKELTTILHKIKKFFNL